MGTKNQKGTVSIENINGRIRLRWRFQKLRYSLNLFSFSKASALEAKKIALQIETDLLTGKLDISLERYKPESQLSTPPTIPKTLISHFESWVSNYRNMDCEKDIDYNSTRNMMLRWGPFDSSTVLKHLNKESFGPRTYNRRLVLLKAFFDWAVKAEIVLSNPLSEVLKKKARRADKPSRKPFTEEEIKMVLEAIRTDAFCTCSNFRHSHYYPFLYFVFKTGVRNSEAVGLRVQHIDTANNFIHIKEALARSLKGTNPAARVRKQTKNGKQRVLPLTDDLIAVIRPSLQNKKPDDLVFTSPKGLAIDDSMFQKRIFSKVLQKLNIEHRVLYACRHTFSTRCINAGINPVTTAFLMGNNPETALRNYTHLVSLPTELPKVM